MVKFVIFSLLGLACWAERRLQQAGGTCTVQPNSNARGVVLQTTEAENEGECCDKCLALDECNTFVYCPQRKGCTNQGRPEQVMDYKFCDLKVQDDVENPEYWFRGVNTDFTSGFVTQETGMILEIASVGQNVARAMVLQDNEDTEEADQCMLVRNANAKGELVDERLRLGFNAAECCQQCQDHPSCNVFVYCPKEDGCLNQGRPDQVLEHTRCDLKYQEQVAQGENPDYWFLGPETDFSSGYILGKDQQEPILPPSPRPTPSPTLQSPDLEPLPVVASPVVDYRPVPSPAGARMRATPAPLPSTNNRVSVS